MKTVPVKIPAKMWTLAALTATLTLGAGALIVPTAAAPADDRGPAADRLSRAAQVNGIERTRLERLLRADGTARLDSQDRLYFSEQPPASLPAAPRLAEAAPFPLDQTFRLHSKPGASRTIHLDFDGYNVAGTVWAAESPSLPTTVTGYNFEGSATTFSANELAAIQDMWRLVAEDYAAFDVDVTTQAPPLTWIDRTNEADRVFGTTALITSNAAWNSGLCGGCSGQAYIGVFDLHPGYGAPHQYYQPAVVLASVLANDPFWVAQTISHEVGHNVGLLHDGRTNGEAYYFGVSGGLWAPIMGASFDNPVSQWSKGEYALANNTQDDFAVMQTYGLPLRPDEPLRALPGGGGVATGYLSTAGDTDSFAFTWSCTGTLTATAGPAAYGANLDLSLVLRDSEGAQVGPTASSPTAKSSDDVATGMDAALTAGSLPPGTYTLELDGVGTGTWAGGGYSDYGSVGAYSLTASGCIDAPPPVAPGAPATLAATPNHTTAAVALAWTAPTSDGGSAVSHYLVSVDGGPAFSVGNVTKHQVTGLSRTAHHFEVSAVNGIGTGPSTGANAAINPPAPVKTKPTVPKRVAAARGPKGRPLTVKVTWRPPASNGGAAVNGYKVRAQKIRNGKVVTTKQSRVLAPSARSFSMRLGSGKWKFSVRARNQVGWSAWSARTKAVQPR